MSREPAVPDGAEHFLIALAHAHARGGVRSRVRDDRTAIEPPTEQPWALLSPPDLISSRDLSTRTN
jgi:hypothetical protein